MAVILGDCAALVFGTRTDDVPMPKIVNFPEGVLRYKVRERCDDLTTIFLKFGDGRFERRYIENSPCGGWLIGSYPIASNTRQVLVAVRENEI